MSWELDFGLVPCERLEKQRSEPATLGLQGQHINHCATETDLSVSLRLEINLTVSLTPEINLPIRAVSPEPPLLAHTSSESRGTFRQKARSLAPLNGWACAVKICHDGTLEDTNSLDGAHIL